jgi:hypothetical protein
MQVYGFPLSENLMRCLWKSRARFDFRIDSASDEV